MIVYDPVKVPFSLLKSIYDDYGEDGLEQKITELNELLHPDAHIDITDEGGALIRSFTKDQVAGIPIWVKVFLDLNQLSGS
jgi:hypothetical protein